MKSSSFQSVVHFVAICIIPINTCMSLFPSDAPKFSSSMNATMGLRTELRFHKATEHLTAEKFDPTTSERDRTFTESGR